MGNAAFDILDGEVPYSVSKGNHDGSSEFNNNFGEARYEDYDWYGGSYETNNHYQIFSAEGYEFLHINLQKDPSASTLAWAQTVVDANLGKPTIISTHDYLDNPGNVAIRTGAGDDIWNGLVKDNPQIFMTLSGHKHRNPASAHMLSDNSAGEPVLQILADFEDYRSDTGETDSGYLSRVIFDTDANTISVKTFSPTYDAVPWLTDSDHQYSFPADFLTQVNGVASRPIGGVPDLVNLLDLVVFETDDSTEVTENGGPDDFTVALMATPLVGEVTVSLADSSNPLQVVVSPAVLTFTDADYDEPQPVTVEAIDDDVSEDDPHVTTIVLTASGTGTGYEGLETTVAVSIAENDCGAWGTYWADVNGDCVVGIGDLAELAFSWLACTTPNEPGCVDMR